MTARDDSTPSFWKVLGWWERRRLSYNLFVIALAIPVACLTILVVYLLPPRGDGDLGDPLLAV